MGNIHFLISIAAYKQAAIALKGDYLCPEINIELSGTIDEVVEVWESLWLALDWGSTKNSLVWAARVLSAIELLPTDVAIRADCKNDSVCSGFAIFVGRRYIAGCSYAFVRINC